MRNNWLGPIFFSLDYSHAKGLLFLLHIVLEDLTKVGNNPKGRFASFTVTPPNDRILCVYAPSGHCTREWLAGKRFFEDLQNYMENKNEGNKNKIILEDFNCIMDKMVSDGGNEKVY